MKLNKSLWLVALIVLPLSAQSDHEAAVELVARYQETMARSAGVTYRFTHEGTGPLSQMFPRTVGEAWVVPSRNKDGLFERARISAQSGHGEGASKIEVVAATNLVQSLDAKTRRVLSAPTWRNGVELVNFQYLMPLALVPQLAHLTPDDVHYKGEKTINGTICAAVEVNIPMADVTLYLGKDDALLRGGVARKPEAWGNGTIEMSITELDTSKSFSADVFNLDVPTGYDRVEYTGEYPTIGMAAPAFSMTGFDGSTITLEKLAGKVVVLDFWATWCAPCKQAMPGLQRLHDQHGSEGLVIIGVNHQEKGDPHAFLKRYKFTYAFASDEGSDIANSYKPNLPMAVVIDREGRIVEIFIGYFGKESDRRLEDTIKDLL